MHFRTKMIIIYASFVTVVAVLIGAWYQSYSFRQYTENEYRNMDLLAQQLSDQFDETVKPMKFVTSYLLSDMDVLDALRTLANVDSGNTLKLRYKEQAKTDIRTKLYSVYIVNNFYRVVIFNQLGDVISNNNNFESKIDATKTIEDLPWIGRMEGNRGDLVLMGPHLDDWGLKNQPMVYSVVKAVQGQNLGFIEVQKRLDTLDELFQVPKSGIKVMVVLENGELLYTNQTGNLDAYYKEIAINSDEGTGEYTNPQLKKEIVSICRSKESGATLLVIEDLEAVRKEAAYITPITVMIAGIFFLISIGFVLAASAHLTKPIRKLTDLMESTHIDSLDEKLEFEPTHDEIEVLNQSYQQVLFRLNKSMIKEKRLSLLQLQAQFDLLQTQVNPHFVYNVLNVISSRGITRGDESICEMCASLAAMLRYATNTKNRTATLAEEMEYLEQYFYLLKARYIHKLEYSIHLDEAIRNQVIPKVLFQQIVENSINHGFENMTDTMRVEVCGFKQDDRWFVLIRDNGKGFEADAIESLKKKLGEIRNKLTKDREHVELEIGGMGIVNMYARLVLLYGDELTFELLNEANGACVIIGAPLENNREDEQADDR